MFIKFCKKRIVSMKGLSISITEYVKCTLSMHNNLVCQYYTVYSKTAIVCVFDHLIKYTNNAKKYTKKSHAVHLIIEYLNQ